MFGINRASSGEEHMDPGPAIRPPEFKPRTLLMIWKGKLLRSLESPFVLSSSVGVISTS